MPRPRTLLAVLLLAAATACGGGSGTSTGEDGDGLVVYSGRNEKLIGPLLERFEKSTGVDLTIRYGGSAELAAQLLEEGSRSPAAVFISQDAGALGALEEAGRFGALAPAVLQRVDAAYRSKEGRWVGLSGRARVVVYDSTALRPADLPKTVFDVTDARFKGEVGIAPTNASFQAFVTAMRVTEGEERTKQFLTALKDNDAQTYDGNAQIVDAVERGDLKLGLVNHYYLLEKASESGGLEKLKARNHFLPVGDPGSLVNVAGIGVLDGRADDRTAKLLDFLLSEEAQRFFVEEDSEYPLVTGIAAPPGVPALEDLRNRDFDLAQLESLQETLALLDEVGLT